MKTNPPAQCALAETSACTGPVTRGRVRERAIELAATDGRSAPDVSKSDWEQAKRELAGEPAPDQQESILATASESGPMDPGLGSTEHQTPESPVDGEDGDGRNESAQLVEDGVAEAEREQMLQAARAAEKMDRREP